MRTLAIISILFFAVPAVAADGGPTKVPAKAAPADVKKDEAKKDAPKAEVKKTGAKKEETKKDEKPAAPVAKAEKEVTWWKMLLSHLMELAFALLGLLLAGLVTVLMRKFGFEAQSNKINELLNKAVGYAEQKAMAASKLEEGKVTSGAEKMELAIHFAERLAKDYKLPTKGKDWWEMKLESWIGVKKNGNA